MRIGAHVLAQDCVAAVCEPGDADGRERTDEQHREAVVKLGRLWSRIGSEPFRHGVHFLDHHLQRSRDLLAERRKEFAALCRSRRDQPHL